MLGREAEALAWMREYIPRVEAFNKGMPPVVAAFFYDPWARIHTQGKEDQADEPPSTGLGRSGTRFPQSRRACKGCREINEKLRTCGSRNDPGAHLG